MWKLSLFLEHIQHIYTYLSSIPLLCFSFLTVTITIFRQMYAWGCLRFTFVCLTMPYDLFLAMKWIWVEFVHCSSCFTPFNSLMDYNSIGIMSFNQSFLFFVWVSYVLTILLLLLQAGNYNSTRFHWPFS
jgi:hypothetical protein